MGPATHAARRQRFVRRTQRAYPLPLDGDATGDAVMLAATRALLTCVTRADVADVLHTAVNDLGGGIVPARLAEGMDHVLDIDVSLGCGEPRVVVVDPLSLERMRLGHHLPALVQDALAAAAACDTGRRQAERAATDPLTKVASRGEVPSRLAAAARGDVACMLDLDRFKQLNDREGHVAGDRALEQFGDLLRKAMRRVDFCARYGGDEFLVLMTGVPPLVAQRRMEDLVERWAAVNDHGTGVSVGLAVVGVDGGAAALELADAALYCAKRAGRGRVELAPPDEEARA